MRQYKVSLVTGASSGIGAAIARQLAEKDIKVYALARSGERLDAVRGALQESQRQYFIPIICDITNRQKIADAIRQLDHQEGIDLLINNAGLGFGKRFQDYTDTETD